MQNSFLHLGCHTVGREQYTHSYNPNIPLINPIRVAGITRKSSVTSGHLGSTLPSSWSAYSANAPRVQAAWWSPERAVYKLHRQYFSPFRSISTGSSRLLTRSSRHCVAVFAGLYLRWSFRDSAQTTDDERRDNKPKDPKATTVKTKTTSKIGSPGPTGP